MKPRTLLVILAISFLIFGVLEGLVGARHERVLTITHGLLIAALCYAWCRADAASRGIVPSRFISLFAGLFPLVGIPVYLFNSRVGPAAWIANGKALLFLFSVGILGGVSVELVNVARS